MADFDKIKINGVPYNVKDTATAQAVDQVASDLAETNKTAQQQGQQIKQQGKQIAQLGQQIENMQENLSVENLEAGNLKAGNLEVRNAVKYGTYMPISEYFKGVSVLDSEGSAQTLLALTDSTTDLTEFPGQQQLYLCLFHNQQSNGDNTAEPRFYLTADGDHMMRIIPRTNNGIWPTLPATRDGSVFYANGMFYIACTDYGSGYDFVIYTSTDFLTWTRHQIAAGLPSGQIWAPHIDPFSSDTTKIGVFVSANENLYYCAVQLSGSYIPTGTASSNSLGISGYIDPCPTSFKGTNGVNIGGAVYNAQCLLAKNETTKRIEFFSYSTVSPTAQAWKNPGVAWPAGVEAPFALTFGNITKLYVDYYHSTTEQQHEIQAIYNGFNYSFDVSGWSVVNRVTFSDDLGFPICGCRHGSGVAVTNEMLRKIHNVCDIYIGATKYKNNYGTRTINLTSPAGGFTITPNYVYRVTGTSITIPQPLNPFGLTAYPILIASDNIAITFTQTPEGSKTYNITNKAGSTLWMVQSKDTLFSPSGV